MKTTRGRRVLFAMIAAQIVLLVAALAFGGAATAEGGALLLLSLWCMGVNIGFLIGGR